MPRLIVHDLARFNVQDIARDNLDAALRFYTAAEAAFDFLASTPGAGPRVDPPIRAAPELRFWPIARFRNYLVLYQPLSDGAEIVRVTHGARNIARLIIEPLRG